ncbi:MAG: hypothetical protein JW920_12035 [Deltaproteobacteria bacterium]|nr:hypothetical protein [Deltaproteobacteria bacterium]
MIWFLIGAAVIVVFLCFRSVSDDPHAWDFLGVLGLIQGGASDTDWDSDDRESRFTDWNKEDDLGTI